uniref:Uncharacterized protein n=1 Tax=Octopus bimaculoides TaxID=37653 RepID=A0A0L8GBQ9_OCTBM|eukprot:XP_014782522.1 PREDICTED: peroxidase-like protein [Octopus bimaculoides]
MRPEIFIVHLLLLASGEFFQVVYSTSCSQTTLNCSFGTLSYRNIDGSCNNYEAPHNSYGKSNTPYGRFLTPLGPVTPLPYKSYRGYVLPKPRVLSQALFTCGNTVNESTLTHLAANFGLFLMHDMFSTKTTTDSCCTDSCLGIAVDAAHPLTSPCSESCIPYHKPSLSYDLNCLMGEINGINLNTHYIDASPIFGSTEAKFNSLTDTGKKLKMTNNFLEINSAKFISGDERINEQPLIMAVYHLFALEYNRIVTKMTTMNIPSAAQHAKKILIAELQHITYNEFLPSLLGQSTSVRSQSSGYINYDPTKKTEIYNSFSIAYKLAVYSMLRSSYKDSNGADIQIGATRQNSGYMDTDAKRDNIINRLLTDKSSMINNHFACIFINDCPTNPSPSGDMAASAIQDSRYMSIAPYSIWLIVANAPSNPNLPYHTPAERTKLTDNYKNLDDIDFASAVLSETLAGDAMVGPTLKKLFEEQFKIVKEGDRFYYENFPVFTPSKQFF